uniref:Uncharacterized protein n=1 Tax=Tetranychus urticae TaxID=32264 RepID=T1JYK3_TETUR
MLLGSKRSVVAEMVICHNNNPYLRFSMEAMVFQVQLASFWR